MKTLTGYINVISLTKLFFISLLASVFTVQYASGQQYVQIGEGTSVTGTTTPSPINIYYRSLHGQVVYTKEELNAAGFFGGAITELGFYIEGVPSHDLPNYTIGIKTTMQGDTSVYDAGAFTTVYNVASYTPVAGGFDMLTLDEPFYWGGTENLLIDLCFEQVPNYTSTGTVRYYPAEYGFRYTRSDGSNQCGIPTNSNTGQKPQLQLAVSGQATNDVGIADLTTPIDFCAGNEDIAVEVRNFGINVIDSLRVNWSFDGVAQSTVLVTNPLDTLGGTGAQFTTVTLGNKSFVNGNAYDLEVWTSFPNGAQDTVSVNDTLRTVLQPSLNGTYTIGGSSPDYLSIGDAVTDLNNYGVCGPVTFNIRNGFYDEQFSINQFSGGGCDVPVIFQSETGDSTGVVINDVIENPANNYIVELNGADGVTFSGINFVGTGTYARIVYMRDGADCNTFESCTFDGSAVSSTSGNYTLVASEFNSNNQKNTFTQNVFKKGSYALTLYGSNSGGIGPPELDDFAEASIVDPDSASLEISDNIFEEQYVGSIFLENYGGARVVDNSLNSNSAYSSWISIRIESLNGDIEGLNDDIEGLAAIAKSLSANIKKDLNANIIENSNGIEVSGNTISALRGMGILLNSQAASFTERNLIANNFITISGDNANTRGIYCYFTTNTDIYHNNINITTTNSTESAGLDIFNFDNGNIINNCIVNTGEGYAIRYDSPTNSVSNYNNFYHAGNNIGYYNNSPIGDLTDWQNANGFDANSISVDPLYTSDTDLHVNTIDLNAAATPLADLPNDIDGDTRDAATPDIGADEFTPPPNDAGVLDITLPDSPFPAGTYPVYGILKNYGTDDLLNTNLYWEINDVLQPVVNWSGTLTSGDTLPVLLGDIDITVDQAYTLRSWTDLPNGAADMFPVNDTTNLIELYAGLGGEYTLGGTDPDFADFATAEDALNRGGVYAPVTINVRDGVYNEQIHLMEIFGVDSTNTVTFQSESGDSTSVVIEYAGTSTDNYIWYLDGADYVTIRSLTIKPLNSSYDVAIRIENQANHNIIENNYFDGNGIYGEMIYSGPTIDEGNIIRNNYFEDGQIAVNLSGSGIRENGNMVIGNIFKDQDRQAIILDDQLNVIVQNNDIENFANNSTYEAIYLYDCDDAIQITGNRILSCCRAYGIQMQYCNSTSGNEGLVANNFVALLRTTGDAYGIYDRYNSYQKYYHNTINTLSSDINGRTFYALNSSNLDLRNNIISNKGTGYAIYTADGNIAVSDNNNFYTEGENITYFGENIATLTDWQSTTGLDAASLSVDPLFESDSNYVVAQISLNAAAQPLAEVSTDIEGNPRDAATPDIGAYEFTPLALDAGVIAVGLPDVPFAVGDHLVQAVLKNFGTDTLTSVVLDWEVNGVAQPSVNWTGMLISDDTLEVGLDFVTFDLGQPYSFKVWSSQPNAQNDLVAVNDTTTINDIYAGLGGSYTLGGTTPDFDDFTEAATVLNLGGVYAPVDIQIRDGSYNEQIELFEIPGADSTNQILLTSENDDPALVTLTYTPNFSNNYVLKLTDTDWLTLEGITLQATGSTYTRVVWLDDNATHNVFSDNIITNPLTTSTSTNRAVIYVPSTGTNEYNGFVNNTISNGSYGIYMIGNYNDASYTAGNYITGNTFENQYYMSLRVSDHQKDMTISDNYISSNSIYSSYYGIQLDDLYDGIDVLRNQVIGATRYGIYVDDISASADAPMNIVNNFIELSGTIEGYGLSTRYSDYQNIYHNTVSVSNTNVESRAFYSYAGSNGFVKNNIFSNTGGGYAYYAGTIYGIVESDYNDIYVTGANTAYWGNTNLITLADWQTTTSFDTTSVAIDPIFVSPTDLHITNVLLDKRGTPIASVTDDIDGDTRDPILPDMGADEFSTAENDASLFSIDSPNIPFPADNQPIYVTLLNNGLDTLLSADIDWDVNDQAQAPFSWTGTLLPGEQADSVLLGNFTFERDTMYSITAWSSNPNGVIDTETYNDTLQLNDLYAALSGIYTIGGVSPDYQDFTEAVTALDRGGVVGEVIFEVRSETFNEQITINEIIGASADNTITFRSEAGDSTQAVLTHNASTSADNYVVRLDGANWVRFEQMTLQSAGNTSYERVIEILNGADNNVFSNNEIIGRDVSSSSTNYAIIYSSGATPNNNNSFLNNYIQQGNYGLYLESGNTSNSQTGTVISGNTFEHQYYNAIYQRYGSGSEITYNQITTNETTTSYEGIYLYNGLGGNIVTHNIIIEVPRGDGIYLLSMNATPAEPNLVANNFIQTGIGSYNLNGILTSSSFYTNIYHNNVHITSTSTSAKSVYIESGGNTNVQNNVLTNTGGGYAIYNNTSNNIISSDYNDLYVTGTNIGAWNNSAVTNLAAWQATSGHDANSISIDPVFVSATDLHVSEIDLNGAATPIAVITDDIDGEPRSVTTPDIGADEFSPATTNDISIEEIVSPNIQTPFPAGANDVLVAIKNNGIDTVQSANIHWTVNNTFQTDYAWTGFLLPGARDTVILGSFDFALGLSNRITSYTSMPGGMEDAIPENDTTTVEDLYAALDGIYTVGGQLPDFFNVADAVNALNRGGVLGEVEFLIRNGTYTEALTINQVKGGSAATPVTFRSESSDSTAVVLAINSSTAINLNGADYLIFRQLTLGYDNYGGRTVMLQNGANHNQFINNLFLQRINNFSGYEHIYSPNSTDSHNNIIGNRFVGSGYGIELYGTNSSTLEEGIIIEDNIFENQESRAIYMTYKDAPIVKNNLITADDLSSNYIGIYMEYCDNDLEVSANEIYTDNGTGMYLYRCDGIPAARANVFNNFIGIGGTAASYGLRLYVPNYVNIYNNSIAYTGSNTNSRCFYVDSGSNSRLINNILANQGDGYAVYVTSSGVSINSDYNNLYTTGTNLGHWAGNDASNLVAWRTFSGRDPNSLSVNPLFVDIEDLHTVQVLLDSAAIDLPEVTVDIDGEPRNPTHPDIGADEINFLPDDIGITALLSPASDCELGNDVSVTVKIQNFSSSPISGFDVAYSINGQTPIVENIGATQVPPGLSIDYIFTQNIDISTVGNYEFSVYTSYNDDSNLDNDTTTLVVENALLPASVTGMVPADGATDLPRGVTLSWAPVNGATYYDLFVWDENSAMPNNPTVSGITQISYYLGYYYFEYGTTYNWQLVAANPYCQTLGPTQAFTIEFLPDLEIQNVQIPASAFSSQNLSVSWETHNTGTGGTNMSQWTDAVYLSADQLFSTSVDTYLGGIQNFSALESNQSYSNTADFTLPNGIQGDYYVFVVTDRYNYVPEEDNNNNSNISIAPVNITLTPPPDLEVTSIIPLNTVFSDQEVDIIYTVENDGTGQTRSGGWNDRVYFSEDTIFTASADYLGQITYTGSLVVDSSYTRTLTANIPEAISGTHYIYILTDYFNDEYEQANEINNTTRSEEVTVILTPPPDLQVISINAPADANTKEVLNLEWTVSNQGGTAAGYPPSWRDRIYISDNPNETDLSNAVYLGQTTRYAALNPGENYTANRNITIPADISGAHYIYVYTDESDNIFEFTNDNNNITRSVNPINILTPDLEVSNVDAPANAQSGDTIFVTWTNTNIGAGTTFNTTWNDQIAISTNATYTPGTLIDIGSTTYTSNLASNDNLNNQVDLMLPNGISGQYYLYVFTDSEDAIYENGAEANNVNTNGFPIQIALAPWVDLAPATLQVPAATNAGAIMTVSYTVNNDGQADLQGKTWTDDLYISNNATWNPATAQLLRTSQYADIVAANSNYQVQTEVNIPIGLASNNYYLHLLTDVEDDIFEYTDENNNRIASAAFVVSGYPPVDLAVNSVMAADSTSSGQSVTVSWNVENLSSTNTVAAYWFDGVYLSTDATWDATDTQLGEWQHTGPLNGTESYANSRSVDIPDGISGMYYLIAVTDINELNNDTDPTNNYGTSTQATVIELTPPPDLVISTFDVPPTATSGQPLSAIWSVSNVGTAPTVSGSWIDRFYLSTDFELNSGDQLVKTVNHSGNLAVGESYTDTMDISIPVNVSGNRILIVKTDFNDVEYELNNENNNTATSVISITQPPPSDLIVSQVQVPSMATAGNPVTIDWTVQNNGQNPAVGTMKEAIYLSDDAAWDINDALIGLLDCEVNLAPLASENRTLTTNLTGVALDDYYAIVRTDILNNIYESDDVNNTTASTNTMSVSVKELPLDILTPDTLANETDLYYRIEIPDSLTNESLLITLKGDSINGANELYLRYGDIATRVNYDYSHQTPYYGNQEIIVPELQAGTYYLLVYGLTTAGTSQDITLLAEKLNFEIRRVRANEGGNTGFVTLEIQGAKFDSLTDMRLLGQGNNLLAESVFYVDPTTVYATFDLRGVTTGLYDVVAQKPDGETAMLTDGFTVVEGGSSSIATNIIHPAATRPDRTEFIRIEYTNNGNIDIRDPIVALQSLAGASASFTVDGLEDNLTQLDLTLTELNGPPDILRPGASGSIVIYVKADNPLGFIIVIPDFD